jgi:hypothetical protein
MEFSSEAFCSANCRGYPRPEMERRVVADMLGVQAVEVSKPVASIVAFESDNESSQRVPGLDRGLRIANLVQREDQHSTIVFEPRSTSTFRNRIPY